MAAASMAIYVLIDPVTSEIRNVGQSVNVKRRYFAHTAPCDYNKGNTYNRRWIRSLAKRNLKPGIIIVEKVSIDQLDDAEMFWIEEFRRLDCKLTNTTEGGGGHRGFKQSAETRQKRSKAIRREKHPMYGKHHSEETKLKISQTKVGCFGPNKGKKWSEETKQKMSTFRKGITAGEKHPNAKLTDDDVRTILHLAREKVCSQVVLAGMYDVRPSVICKIIKRKSWTHII